MVKTPHARRATKYLGIGLLVLFLVALLAVACVSQKSPVPPARQVATSPPLPSQPRNLSESTPAPSAPPPDALAVVATTAHAMAHPETPATVGPGGYSTLMVVRDTAVAVRATASPFPTAGPPTVQPGQPARVFAQRGGLSLRLEVTKDTYLAGEGGRAEIALSNDGPET
ncbi:MAG: hypothetical protein IT330_12395, partial [Anaerolineae bacterium]|nr:hypothetical protein [Anaerolineae bacterium]